MQSEPRLHAGDFYETYHGHTTGHLDSLRDGLKSAGARRFVYFAGDSSLDNKHWLFDCYKAKQGQLDRESHFVAPALNGYERVLKPPRMVKDVCYWLNKECAERSGEGSGTTCVINTAVEESCLVQRETDGLLPQDEFIRTHITPEDILVVDVGGNDVALRPTTGVIFNMLGLIYLTPTAFIRWSASPFLWYFYHMFSTRLRRYVEQLVAVQKPKKVIICMLYFLDEQSGGSWADGVLAALGYDSNPLKLQTVMRQVYSWGVSQIRIPGVEVVALPLFEVLDGKCTADYLARVEPSVQGGQKMAQAIAAKIFSAGVE